MLVEEVGACAIAFHRNQVGEVDLVEPLTREVIGGACSVLVWTGRSGGVPSSSHRRRDLCAIFTNSVGSAAATCFCAGKIRSHCPERVAYKKRAAGQSCNRTVSDRFR